jgi:hypothetical protein
MYLGATGQVEPHADGGEEIEAGETPADAVTAPAPAAGSALEVPAELDAESAQSWIFEQGLVGLEAGELVEDRAAFAALSAKDAARLHEALRSGGKSHEPLRLHFFALCGELPVEARREFASLTGAVFRGPGHKLAKSYMGDFSRLLFLQTDDPDSPYARAVRDFAEVLEDKEMIGALTDLGVVDQADDWDGWFMYVEKKMADFDPETLLAIRDTIKNEWFGDRSHLREYIGDLAEAKLETD